jgi:DNA-binding transcriptional ArsR family regulator
MARGTGLNEPAAGHLPVLVDPRLVRGLSHVLRQHILLATLQREISPNELSKALGKGLSQVSYHVKVLRKDCDGLIEQTRTEPRRGAVEHFYRASAKTLLPASAWRRLKKGLRAVVGAGLASDLFNDLADALKAGKLQGAHDHIARTPLVLDAEGQRKVKAIAERSTAEVESEQRAAAKRMERANGDGGKAVGYIFALLAFEAAWEPADLHALAAHVEDSAPASANGARQGGGGSKRAKRKAAAGNK